MGLFGLNRAFRIQETGRSGPEGMEIQAINNMIKIENFYEIALGIEGTHYERLENGRLAPIQPAFNNEKINSNVLVSGFYREVEYPGMWEVRLAKNADLQGVFYKMRESLLDGGVASPVSLAPAVTVIDNTATLETKVSDTLIAIISGTADVMEWPQYLAIALAAAGVIGLGFVEANEDDALRAARQEASNFKYAKSWLALALPIAYCCLDAAGTFADDLVLETLNEDSANVAYELTFLAAGVFSFLFLLIKKQKFFVRQEGPKYIGAIFETAGQLAYIYALASGESALAAPIISSYCVASVLWSRIFLKEKLSWKHYACIATTIVGIIIMGVYDM